MSLKLAFRDSVEQLSSRMLPLSRPSPPLRITILLLTFHRFHAIFEYLYTREIDFKVPRFTRPSGVPLPSAKSVYRLADMVSYYSFHLCR